MFQLHSMRIVTLAGLGMLLVLLGDAWAGEDLKADAAAKLEVRMLEVMDTGVAPGPGERSDMLYRMEVISVLRSSVRVRPGDSILVRSYALSQDALDAGGVAPKVPAPGWLGVAYLNPDRKAGGSDAGRQFAVAAAGESFEDIPPGPPAIRWTQ